MSNSASELLSSTDSSGDQSLQFDERHGGTPILAGGGGPLPSDEHRGTPILAGGGGPLPLDEHRGTPILMGGGGPLPLETPNEVLAFAGESDLQSEGPTAQNAPFRNNTARRGRPPGRGNRSIANVGDRLPAPSNRVTRSMAAAAAVSIHEQAGLQMPQEEALGNEGPTAHSAPRARSVRTRRVGRPRGSSTARSAALSANVQLEQAAPVLRSRPSTSNRPRGRPRGRPRAVNGIASRAVSDQVSLQADLPQNISSVTQRGSSSRTNRSSNVSRHERNRRHDYNANRRDNYSAEEIQRIRTQDAQQHQVVYHSLPNNDLQVRREVNAQQHRDSYHSLPGVDRRALIEQNSQRRREYFDLQPEAHQAQRNRDADQHRDSYHSLPDADRHALIEQNSQRRREYFDLHPDAQQVQRDLNAQQHRDSYHSVPERAVAVSARNNTRQQQTRNNRLASKAAILNDEGRLREGIPEEDYLGPLSVQCTGCGALHFADERVGRSTLFTICCHKGKIADILKPLPYPERLQKWFTDANSPTASVVEKADSKEFLKNIRFYNNESASASISYKQINPPGRGPFVYKIQGTIYHYTFNIKEIREGELAHRNQLYILDTADQTAHRQDNARRSNRTLNQGILNDLKHILDESNSTCRDLKRMFEMAADVENVKAVFAPVHPGRPNAQRERLPESREIVGVVNETDENSNRGVTITFSNNEKVFFNYDKGVCDPMTYPVFFPNGELGWDRNLRLLHKITPKQFYCYNLSIRNVFCPILHGRDLFQQYSVDCGTKMIRDRIDFIKLNQNVYWAEERAVLENHLIARERENNPNRGRGRGRGRPRNQVSNENPTASRVLQPEMLNQQNQNDNRPPPVQVDESPDVGQRVSILPATFVDGPRYRKGLYYDAMAIIGKFGKPDLFITFTCNPNWTEITENLKPGEKASDRPDLVSRVFNLKSERFIYEITVLGIFGKVIAWSGVIEFQKRGLPHLHIMIILDPSSKVRSISQVDAMISAELPDVTTGYPEDILFCQRQKEFMLHRKCGEFNPGAICMRSCIGARYSSQTAGNNQNPVQQPSAQQVVVEPMDVVVNENVHEADDAALDLQLNVNEIIRQPEINNIELDTDSSMNFVPNVNEVDHQQNQNVVDETDDESDIDSFLVPDAVAEADEFADIDNDNVFNEADDLDALRDMQASELYNEIEAEVEALLNEQNDFDPESGNNEPEPLPVNNEIGRGGFRVNPEVCGKRFPKPFQQTTDASRSFILYRRRDTGVEVERNGVMYNNQWVVPSNPYLLMRFNAHINIEICATSAKICKYLYKYCYKGSDGADIALHHEDEIKAYVEAKYISPCEAIYRIFGFKTHYNSHAVIRLDIHLEDHQRVYFANGQEAQAARPNRMTTLTAVYQLNKRCREKFDDPNYDERVDRYKPSIHRYVNSKGEQCVKEYVLSIDARQFHYYEIPEHFVYDKTGLPCEYYFWKTRQASFNTIGSMYQVSCNNPQTQEKYYCRLLLLYVKGMESEEDIRTHNGVVYATFKEAAISRGLLIDDNEHIRCLEEAVNMYSETRIRYLFVLILSLGNVHRPIALYEQFKTAMMKDYRSPDPNHAITAEEAEIFLFRDLMALSKKFNYDITRYISAPQNFTEAQIDEIVYQNENSVAWRQKYEQMNADQRAIFDAIYESSISNDQNTTKCFYINGPAGTGKTFIYQALYNRITAEFGSNMCICVAYSGIAASLLPKGRTAHSAFRLKFSMTADDYYSTLHMQEKHAQVLRNAKLIIWDEISMVPHWALKSVDQLFKDLLNNHDIPFGGKTFVIGGDFQQLLPVVKGGIKSDVMETIVKMFPHWNQFKKFSLTINQRSVDPEFREFLLRIGKGDYGEITLKPGTKSILIPERYLSRYHRVEEIPLFVDEIYDGDVLRNNDQSLISASALAQSAILATTNEQVAKLNAQILARMTSFEKKFYSTNTVVVERPGEQNDIAMEHLIAANPAGVPPHELHLKEGCIVMLLRNWSVEDGLTNGTRLRVLKLQNNGNSFSHYLECEIITNSGEGNSGRPVLVPRMTFIIDTETSGLDHNFKRVQFPVCLAFAMTIHKSQGQTFDKVGIYLENIVFAHGQLYVAMSRCRNPEKLRIFNLCESDDMVQRRSTANIVWPEALFEEQSFEHLLEGNDSLYDNLLALPDNEPGTSNFAVPEHNSNLRQRIN